jgi:outer membrane protein, heavy metal efflux system
MLQRIRVGPAAWRAWSLFVVTIGVAGSSHAIASRYEALMAELEEAAPATSRIDDEQFEFDDLSRLDRQVLVETVLARNPSAESAREAWRAALADYPQVRALDDPTVEYSLAPSSIASDAVSYGQVVSVGQRFPWPGKLALEGETALAEAEAAREDYQATRLQLALMASLLFDHYYAVARSLVLTEEHRLLMEDIKAVAVAQFEAGRASQQDALQAELDLSHVLHEQVVFESRRSVIVAQINGLLHRQPQLPLPPPPEQLEPVFEDYANSEALQEEALRRRPELHGTRFRIQARESAVHLAKRQSYPDFGVMTSYNSKWMAPDHRWAIGVSLNIPIQRGARRSAVGQAEARLRQDQLQLSALVDAIRAEVEQSRQHVLEAQHVVRLYQERLLPAARAQIDAARIGYETGRDSFQALVAAERSLRTLEIQYEESLVSLRQRRAELQRAIGHIPGLAGERSAP